MTMGTTATTRSVVDSYYAAWNAHDPDAVAAHFDPDGVRHWRVVNNPAVRSPERFEGTAAIAEGVKAFMDLVGDLRVEPGTYAETDDGAIFEWICSGHLTGTWGDWEGHGEVLELPGVSIARLSDGRFLEERMYFDPDMMARNWRPEAA
jgi:ketosteroid isomerase-like protein